MHAFFINLHTHTLGIQHISVCMYNYIKVFAPYRNNALPFISSNNIPSRPGHAAHLGDSLSRTHAILFCKLINVYPTFLRLHSRTIHKQNALFSSLCTIFFISFSPLFSTLPLLALPFLLLFSLFLLLALCLLCPLVSFSRLSSFRPFSPLSTYSNLLLSPLPIPPLIPSPSSSLLSLPPLSLSPHLRRRLHFLLLPLPCSGLTQKMGMFPLGNYFCHLAA